MYGRWRLVRNPIPPLNFFTRWRLLWTSQWKHLCSAWMRKMQKSDESVVKWCLLHVLHNNYCTTWSNCKLQRFFHTSYAVSLCLQQQERLQLVTKWLYLDVAKRYGTNWKAVECNIRTISSVAWKRNRALLELLVQHPLDRLLQTDEFLAVLSHTVMTESTHIHNWPFSAIWCWLSSMCFASIFYLTLTNMKQ